MHITHKTHNPYKNLEETEADKHGASDETERLCSIAPEPMVVIQVKNSDLCGNILHAFTSQPCTCTIRNAISYSKRVLLIFIHQWLLKELRSYFDKRC